MTATDELRKLLDERGVEHYDGTECTLWLKDEHGYRASADELTSGRLSVHIWCDTPEQAIAATLGRGECHEVIVDEYWRGCGNCGYVWEYMYGIGKCTRPNFCPRCGAKVARVFNAARARERAEALRADSSPAEGETE